VDVDEDEVGPACGRELDGLLAALREGVDLESLRRGDDLRCRGEERGAVVGYEDSDALCLPLEPGVKRRRSMRLPLAASPGRA